MSLTALVLALAVSQGYASSKPGLEAGKTLASFPLTTSGPLIAEDANTVAHVYWNDTTLVDTKGNAWTMNGTVPQVSANPFTVTRYGAGPFSAANRYTLGSGADVLDFASDFTVCVVFAMRNAVPAADEYLFANYNPGVFKGYALRVVSGGQVAVQTCDGAACSGTNSSAAAGVNISCFGRASGTRYVKTNLAATGSAAAGYAAPSDVAAEIGARNDGTQPLTDGTIYEVYATSTAWSEATVTAIQQKVLGHFDGSSPLSVTRANSNATYLNGSCAGTDQCLWTAPANVARITTDGLLVEPQRINYAQQSNTMSTGTAATSPWALSNATVTTVAGAPLTGTWAEVTSTNTNGLMYQTIGAPSGTGLTASVWTMTGGSGAHGGVGFWCGSATTVSGCACGRSDGGTCSASSPSAGSCQATLSDNSTTPVRLWVSGACSAIGGTPNVSVHTGSANGNRSRYVGAQLEVGTYPTSLIVTTTTSATRNADVVTATVPAVPSKWCIATSGKPVESMAWAPIVAATFRLWALGPQNGSGTAFLTENLFRIEDGATAADLDRAYTMPATGEVRIVACGGPSKADLTLSAGSVGALSGVGTGVVGPTPATTLYLGSRSTGNSLFSGFLKNLKLCAASNAKGCK